MKRESSSLEQVQFCTELAQPEDASAIALIQRDTWLATYPNEALGITVEDIAAKGLGSEKKVEFWKRTIEKQGEQKQIWITRKNQTVVGYCVAEKQEKEHYLGGLYVLPTEQGQGIGKKLMEKAFAWFGTDKPIVLSVASYNADSIAFYKRLGFEETTEDPEVIPPLPSGKSIPLIKMIKKFAK